MSLVHRIPLAMVSVVVGMIALSPQHATAQPNGPCMDSTSSISRFYRNSYEGIATTSNADIAAWRASKGIPTLTASQVRLVADTAICRSASTAFDARVNEADPAAPVVVIELGSKRLVIKDLPHGGRLLNMLFNTDFTILYKVLSL